MEKRNINVSGYPLTQLAETAFEAENAAQKLDFYFDTEDSEEVVVTVFDSLISTNAISLGVFFANSLDEAVTDAMLLTKGNLKESLMWT